MAARNDDPAKREERENDDIKVTDRRKFTLEGELKDAPESEAEIEETVESKPVDEAPPAPAPDAPGAAEPAAESAPGFERQSLEEPEGVDFTMLINAMAQPALIFLGEIAHPGTGKAEINLEQARLQIDLLDMLRIKCRGNLSAEEDGLLDRILYQLRMLYVTRSSQPPE